MSVKRIPEKVVVTCDCCGNETHQSVGPGRRRQETHMKISRHALDYLGDPAADGTVEFDFCDACAKLIEGAINHTVACYQRDAK